MTSVLAQATGCSSQDAGYYRIRSPLKPITIGELASVADLSNMEDRS
jgi:hypothetical protein